MNDAVDKQIRQAIFHLLKEQQQKPVSSNSEESKTSQNSTNKPKEGSESSQTGENQGVISTTGAFGSGGRSKSFVAAAGARADSDPEGLLEDLGVTSASGGDDLSAAHDVISTAIASNIVMGEAYSGAKLTMDTIGTARENKRVEVVSIQMGSLDRKNGVRFLAHTLIAAQNAGVLSLAGGLQFAQGESSPIVIYSI